MIEAMTEKEKAPECSVCDDEGGVREGGSWVGCPVCPKGEKFFKGRVTYLRESADKYHAKGNKAEAEARHTRARRIKEERVARVAKAAEASDEA